MKKGNGKVGRIENYEEMNKGENIVKWLKGQRISCRRIGCPKRSSLKNWKGREEGEDPEKDGRGSRKRSSSAGSEKMERVGGR